MPAKRRKAKARRLVTDAARAIFADRPDGIDDRVILDADLAEELGRVPLIAYPDLGAIIEQLSEDRASRH